MIASCSKQLRRFCLPSPVIVQRYLLYGKSDILRALEREAIVSGIRYPTQYKRNARMCESLGAYVLVERADPLQSERQRTTNKRGEHQLSIITWLALRKLRVAQSNGKELKRRYERLSIIIRPRQQYQRTMRKAIRLAADRELDCSFWNSDICREKLENNTSNCCSTNNEDEESRSINHLGLVHAGSAGNTVLEPSNPLAWTP